MPKKIEEEQFDDVDDEEDVEEDEEGEIDYVSGAISTCVDVLDCLEDDDIYEVMANIKDFARARCYQIRMDAMLKEILSRSEKENPLFSKSDTSEILKFWQKLSVIEHTHGHETCITGCSTIGSSSTVIKFIKEGGKEEDDVEVVSTVYFSTAESLEEIWSVCRLDWKPKAKEPKAEKPKNKRSQQEEEEEDEDEDDEEYEELVDILISGERNNPNRPTQSSHCELNVASLANLQKEVQALTISPDAFARLMVLLGRAECEKCCGLLSSLTEVDEEDSLLPDFVLQLPFALSKQPTVVPQEPKKPKKKIAKRRLGGDKTSMLLGRR